MGCRMDLTAVANINKLAWLIFYVRPLCKRIVNSITAIYRYLYVYFQTAFIIYFCV